MHSRSFSSFCSCSLFLTMNLLKNQIKEKTDIERTIKQIFSIAVYIGKMFQSFFNYLDCYIGETGRHISDRINHYNRHNTMSCLFIGRLT